MKSRLLPLALFPVTLGSLVVAAIACSGSSSDTPTGTTGPSNDASSPSSNPDSSSPGADSSSGNPGNGNDANAPGNPDTGGSQSKGDGGDIPDGGVPVTPGVIQCGAVNCDVSSSTCCAEFDGGATCVSGATTTCSSGGTLHCLEAADCTSPQVCCGTFSIQSISPLEATANTQCATGPCPTTDGAQFCRTNSECLNGQPCVPQTCSGVKLELCGLQSQYGCTAN